MSVVAPTSLSPKTSIPPALTAIPEEAVSVVSFEQPCEQVEDSACENLAMKAYKTWSAIVLGRSSGFHEAFVKNRVQLLVLQYTGEYHKCCKIALQKKLVFCPPPLGKPNPHLTLDPEGSSSRMRIAQSPQKTGQTCWFYAAKMISLNIGKNPHSSQLEQRQIEQRVSKRRKAHTELQEKLLCQLGFAQEITTIYGSITKVVATSVLKYKREMSFCVKSRKCCSLLEAFGEQAKHSDLLSYVTEICLEAQLAVEMKFVEGSGIDPQQYYEGPMLFAFRNQWKDLSLSEVTRVHKHLADYLSFMALGLQRSCWHPSQGIESLSREIWLHGPHLVQGFLGRPFYAKDPELAGTVNGWTIWAWPPNATRVERGTQSHVNAIVGTDCNLKRVYYRDPLNGSDPKQKAKAKTYAMSYNRLIEKISNLHGIQLSLKGKPFFTAVRDGENEYALHGNPRTNYL